MHNTFWKRALHNASSLTGEESPRPFAAYMYFQSPEESAESVGDVRIAGRSKQADCRISYHRGRSLRERSEAENTMQHILVFSCFEQLGILMSDKSRGSVTVVQCLVESCWSLLVVNLLPGVPGASL